MLFFKQYRNFIMRPCKRRTVLMVGLVLFIAIGYWCGFDCYKHIASLTLRNHHIVMQQMTITVIGDNSRLLRKLPNMPTQVDNRAINGDKPEGSSKYVDTTTSNLETTRPASNKEYNEVDTSQQPRSVPTKDNHKAAVSVTSTVVNTSIGKLNTATIKSQNVSKTIDTKPDPTSPGSKTKPTSNVDQNNTLYITPKGFRKGRLGNQMFRYASMIGMAKAQGRTPFVLPYSQLQKAFKLRHVKYLEGSDGWPSVRESNPYSFDPKMMDLPLKNLSINGFLQSLTYFADVEKDVRAEFTFLDYISNNADDILRNIKAKYRTSVVVGVHVRRGDFLKNEYRGYAVPEKSYFVKAFDWMKSHLSGINITFAVASDDLQWCNDNLVADDVTVIPPAPSHTHLAVLSKCDHVIISGGSFGWWGAWLSGGSVVYYTGYMAANTSLGRLHNPKTYYPSTWMGIGD